MPKKIFRIFADLRFSIFILLLISICSIIGTIIEQDQAIEIYKNNYPLINPVFGFLSWNRIIQFGLNHVYKTWWFLGLIGLLSLSLILCSFLQQLPSLKIARRCQFFRTINSFYKLELSTVLNNFSLNKIIAQIKQQDYSIFHQQNIIYCYRGLIGRVAPIIVHFSMILILFGTIIGALFGFKAQELVPKTENFHIQNILNSGFLTVIPTTSARINDFWITYTKTQTIFQFYSDISILNLQGQEIERKTVAVNQPFIYKKIYYYQTDWNLIGLRLQSPSKIKVEYPLLNILNEKTKIWLTWVSNNKTSDKGNIVILNNLEGSGSIYNEIGQFVKNVELNEIFNFEKSFYFVEIISSTGLQVKTDPGIPIIYFGFLFLMISTLLSYVSYSQIWIVEEENQIFIGGNTNRAFFEFELEFFKFIK